MIKRHGMARFNRLGAALTLHAVVSVCVALTVFFIAQAGAQHLYENLSAAEHFQERRKQRIAEGIQDYVREQDVTLADIDRLWDMPGAQERLIMAVYSKGVLLCGPNENALQFSDIVGERLYPIYFSDGEAALFLWDYNYYIAYYRIADLVCAALAFAVFTALFLWMIRKKLRYILRLERELEILEGGDLSYAITIQGNDELTNLARGIDDMRRSFIERQEGENEAIRARQSLVTAMSHDLRTPLTSLLGYIELIQAGQYTSDEQLKHFISASRDKVYRIKELSDALFEYALCDGEAPVRFRRMDAYELLSQLLTENSFELESAGFVAEVHMDVFHAEMQVDPGRIARVMENLTSNIKKYADPETPVKMRLQAGCAEASICVSNRKLARSAAESTGIGLKTCAQILEQHNGTFEVKEEGGQFSVAMTLPLAVGFTDKAS